LKDERELRRLLERNLASVRLRIRSACARAGRPTEEVTLVAVTKTLPPRVVALLAELGQKDFGENRVQEALAKVPECPSGLRWHLIGHLQRNKVGKCAGRFDVFHAVDGAALAQALERAADKAGRELPCFLEVNVSGEPAKHGATAGEAESIVHAAAENRWARLVGLMTMAPFDADPEHARPHFRALRELRDRLNAGLPAVCRLSGLSMGMSQDFETAIEEGATHVRVGTALFVDTHTNRAERAEDPGDRE